MLVAQRLTAVHSLAIGLTSMFYCLEAGGGGSDVLPVSLCPERSDCPVVEGTDCDGADCEGADCPVVAGADVSVRGAVAVEDVRLLVIP
jgi:hypothetical protein